MPGIKLYKNSTLYQENIESSTDDEVSGLDGNLSKQVVDI
jgi:hypothetical protein